MLEIIKQKYNIIRKIGQGGMAQIYLATEFYSNEKIAIKILEPASINDIIKQKRFKSEIEILKKINSPYVAKMYNAELTNNYAYIAMEFVDGYILKEYINKFTRLTVDEAVEFTKQLTLGFDSIHKNNIIHRDIKSQNVMVGENGRVKIIDFGIALDVKTERLTKTNMLIGSPQYVSPELIKQESPTRHSDIYALGVLLYEMLSGKVPFSGKDAHETLKKHQSADIPKITKFFPNIPQSVENIIIRSTAKKPSQRYNTMYEMYLDLDNCLNFEGMNAKPLRLDQKDKKLFLDFINSWWTSSIMLFLLLVIILFLIFFIIKGF